MERDSFVFCDHCNENVSRSTFRRHQLLSARNNANRLNVDDSAESSDSVSSDEETMQSGTATQGIPLRNNNDAVSVSDSDAETEDDFEHNVEDFMDQEDQEESGMEEHWDEISPQDLEKDIGETPLPEPVCKKRKLQSVNSIVFWLVYFLLVWQTYCKVSDNGMAWLLQFLIQFLKIIRIEVSNDYLSEIITLLPTSVYLLKKYINFDKDAFTKYVVCPKCTKLYTYDSCLSKVRDKIVPKTCNNTFASRGRKKVCDAALVKKVILKDKTETFYPIVYYCYNSIINELERLVQRKGFMESCEKWRDQEEDGNLSDVYNGQIWKEFLKYKGQDFLNSPRNYGFMLNFDFFQPMKHRKDYSVGVFYLVLLNLPRSERFQWKNVIVVGIVPSVEGSEPKNLNEFLKPSIKELQCLWKGMKLKTSISDQLLKFRAAILSISADIPAARKLCGFKGHGGYRGCSRCLKVFSGGFQKRDYSGFDKENWPARTNDQHRIRAMKIEKTKKVGKKKELCKDYGINYWSPLLDLDYFDIIRFCTVDPMHNLFLGTAKYVFKLWDKQEIISKKGMKLIEGKIEKMDVPTNIGRLPKKISSNYGSYTAEQWKNWTLIYSMFALKDVLLDEHLRCWQSFVLACKYLCKNKVSSADLQRADFLILKFCREFELLYGKECITPNMHLHCHLKEIISDHGPVHSFWCFSFERYNGIMGSINTNKRSVELQLMRKLMLSRFLDGLQTPTEYQQEFQHLTCGFGDDRNELHALTIHRSSMSAIFPIAGANWSLLSNIALPSQYICKPFEKSDLDTLRSVYNALYPGEMIDNSNLGEIIKKCSFITMGSEHYGSRLDYRYVRSSRIYASWVSPDGGINLDRMDLFAGEVEYYFSHSLRLGDRYLTHVFACILWFKPDDKSDMFGNPTKTWKARDYIEGGPSRFMPVQRIHCRFAGAEIIVNGARKVVTVPLDLSV